MTGKRQFKITIVSLLIIIIIIISYSISYRGSIDKLVYKKFVTPINLYNNNHDKIIKYQTPKPFTIVTAASANHFCAIKSWLYQLKGAVNSMEASKRPRIIVYDLGLLAYQYRWLNILLKKGYMTELRRFDFEVYPEFWRIQNHTRGEYGWKPGIISEVIKDYPGPTLWLDSGTYVSPGFLNRFEATLDHYDGFFSPISSGDMLKWTHPGVFKFFNDDSNKYANFSNCNGAAIGFDSNKVGSLLNNWVECALVKECIAPNGSSRENHRQDQAILTYLAARDKKFCVNQSSFFGLKIHMDKECKKNIQFYEKQHNITSPLTSKKMAGELRR